MIKKLLISLAQILIWITFHLIYFGRVKVFSDKKMPVGKILLASNHAHELDPFIIGAFIPPKILLKTFPYKFMVANVYYYRWWKPFAWLVGSFPASKKHEGQNKETYGVGASRKFLGRGYSVFIFPEGKRTSDKITARSGIRYILEDSDTELLLSRIVWNKKKITIHYELNKEDSIRSDPQKIIEEIYSLSK